MDRQATNLADALRAFSPLPLDFGTEENPYYVKRGHEPLHEIRTWLLKQQEPAKFLLAGHRGSGKSTELNRLAAQPAIQERFAVVKYSVQKLLDLVDLDYVDLLFISAAITFDQLVTAGPAPIALQAEIVDQLDRWRRTVVEKMTDAAEGAEVGVEGGAKLNILGTFFAGFQSRLRLEHTTRKITRETIEPRVSDFLKTLELFYKEVDAALADRGQRLLLIVEDLDKIPDIEKAHALFREKGSYLAQPPCSILYTVPIALHYDSEFQGVIRTFGHSVFLPNVPLVQRNGEPYPPGEGLMRRFVEQRIASDLIEPDALAAAVAASGGVFQQIQRLMEKACLRALGSEERAISKDDVDHAARDLRFELERALASEHYAILDEVERTAEAPADAEVLRLLHSLHLIEYRNDDRWCQINPLLTTTLKRWRGLAKKRKSARS